jgi:nucleoside-diphosphate-sugar epimerase
MALRQEEMTMRVLILGGGGMVGQKLANRLASEEIAGALPVRELVLYDIAEPAIPPAEFTVHTMVGNMADNGEAERLAAIKADVIFHLASIVSGEAERNFDRGWDLNTRATWEFIEALRRQHDASAGAYVPRLVFTSSIAVFGPPFPDAIDDDFLCAPQTSYGAQKAIIELLIADYSRKGFMDGFSIRLPTICVRPGKPNLAASSFFSGIIREPLNGVEAILPVPLTVRHWHASPRSAARFLTHAAMLDTARLEGRRSLNMPGVSCTVAEQIDALRKIAGDDVASLIRHERDEAIEKIVLGWPRNFDPRRALALGFSAESSFEEIIRVYLEDDLSKAS